MDHKPLVLALEDRPECSFVLSDALGEWVDLQFFTTIEEFQSALPELVRASRRPELVLADVSLEDGNFLQELEKKSFRALNALPFIILSASEELSDMRQAFHLGAMDYLVKPFSKNELLSKVERALTTPKNRPFPFHSKKLRHLTYKEAAILWSFINAPNQELSRETLLKLVWGDIFVQGKTVDVHLHNLKKKMQLLDVEIKSRNAGVWQLCSYHQLLDEEEIHP